MNRRAIHSFALAFATTIPALFVGCDRPAPIAKPSPVVQNSPEERFKRVVDTFRRKMEGQPIGFVVVDGTTRSTLMGTNKVTSELIRPETADGNFKAVITVTTESRYSIHRSKSALDEAEHEQNKNKSQNSAAAAADPKEKKGIGILDPDLTTTRGEKPQVAAKTQQPEEETVTRRPNEDVRHYELVDDGDHWQLITKLDSKTEQSIQFAFDDALSRQ